jgi:sugar phosphate isomerase/epimerase
LDDLIAFHLKLSDVYLMLPRISSDDDSKRNAEITLFKALLPFLKSIGTAGITISPGLAQPAEDTAAFTRTAEVLRDLLSATQKFELPLSIEPHLDALVATPEQAQQMLEAVPQLQLTLDLAHMVCQKAKLKDVWALLPHTRRIHIRQAKAKRLQTPFEKGAIDLQEVMTALQSAHYTEVITIEYLQTVDWHGTQAVNSITECVKMRDALKLARDAVKSSS